MVSPETIESIGPDGPPAGAFEFSAPEYHPRWWLHLLLFVLTFASTTTIGGLAWSGLPPEMAELGWFGILTDPRLYLAGLKFSVPLMTILTCHELGHYIAARIHSLRATPPFFIPLPLPILGIGTLGAVIRIKDPIANKKQLLDVGAAGPIAGFVAIIPFLAYGIAASQVIEIPTGGNRIVFAEPLIYELLEWIIWPGIGDTMTLALHPTGIAAWFGVLITLLNMLPFAQLDGGHVTYAVLGSWHRKLAWPLLGGLLGLGFVWPGWFLWVVIAIIMRPQHPRLWDEDIPLDPLRRVIGWTAIAIFLLCFMAEPIKLIF